jgi:hypothetical protein
VEAESLWDLHPNPKGNSLELQCEFDGPPKIGYPSPEAPLDDDLASTQHFGTIPDAAKLYGNETNQRRILPLPAKDRQQKSYIVEVH